jgi:hypothetical protein
VIESGENPVILSTAKENFGSPAETGAGDSDGIPAK